MLADLKRFLDRAFADRSGESTGEADAAGQRVAIAALLVEMSRADHDVDDEEREVDEVRLMANVEIVESSSEKIGMEEGCLSVPDLRFELERPETIRIAFQDIDGNPVELETGGQPGLGDGPAHEGVHAQDVPFARRASGARPGVLPRVRGVQEPQSVAAGVTFSFLRDAEPRGVVTHYSNARSRRTVARRALETPPAFFFAPPRCNRALVFIHYYVGIGLYQNTY